MDLSISEQQEMLLYKACKDNGGTLTIQLARRMYSSKSSAQSAIQSLEVADFIEYVAPGTWRVEKLTRDIKEELGHVKKKSGSGSASESSGSEYLAEPVS